MRRLLVFVLLVLAPAALADKVIRSAKAEVVSLSLQKTSLPDGGSVTSWNICGRSEYSDGSRTEPTCRVGRWPGDDGPSLMRGKGLQLWKQAEGL
jgi:hypothetical protein